MNQKNLNVRLLTVLVTYSRLKKIQNKITYAEKYEFYYMINLVV